jgi:hypothetical protein
MVLSVKNVLTPCILIDTYRPLIELGAGIAACYRLDGLGFEPFLGS